MQQKHCHRLAYNVAPADNNAVFAAHVHACFSDKLHNSRGSAWQKTEIAYHDMAHVFRVESVNVLFGTDSIYYRILVYLLWQRELHQYSVYLIVIVKLFNKLQKLRFGSLLRQSILI